MSKLEQLQEKLAGLDAERRDLNKKIATVKDELAKLCPVSIGDVVQVDDGAGFGTHNGVKIKVDRIEYLPQTSWLTQRKTLFKCTGCIVLKDGSLSEHISEHIC